MYFVITDSAARPGTDTSSAGETAVLGHLSTTAWGQQDNRWVKRSDRRTSETWSGIIVSGPWTWGKCCTAAEGPEGGTAACRGATWWMLGEGRTTEAGEDVTRHGWETEPATDVPGLMLVVSVVTIVTDFTLQFPTWGRDIPFPPCPFTSPSFALFLLFPFLGGFNYFLLLSIPFLSTRRVPLRFQAGGRRKRPNLGLVCWVYFVLSVFLS